MDCSLQGFSVHGIFLVRILEWVAMSYSHPEGRAQVSCIAGRFFEPPGKLSLKATNLNVHCVSVAQSCPTLRYPMDCSLPGSSIQGIFHARVLEWGAIAFSQKMLRGTQLITPKLSTKPFAFRIFHSCLLSEDFQMLKPSYVSSLSPLRCWLPDVPEEE